jgi:uncharacterized protein YkwD
MTSRTLLGTLVALSAVFAILLVTNNGPSVVHSPEAMSQYPTTTVADADVEVADHTSMLPGPTTTFAPSPSTTIATRSNTTTAEPATTTTTAPKQTTTTVQATTTTTVAEAAGSYNSAHEGSFASLINDHRSSNGLSALSRDGTLDAEARAWSKHMAEAGGLSHSDIGRFLPPWSTVGENVGYGGTVTTIFNSLVASSGHNENMLNGSFSAFGIGVWVDADGLIWTTHIFAG